MEQYKIPAGVPNNEDIQLKLARKRMDPKCVGPPARPSFPLNTDRRPDYPSHYGWNPVYWSDYPKQPAWTVPMPRIAAPLVGGRLPPVKALPCHFPPTEHLVPQQGVTWVPDLPCYNPKWNPYVSESNITFQELMGPPVLRTVRRV